MSTDSLSAREQTQLQLALQRASEFEKAEHMDLMRQPLQGQLSKFTNVMSGWQSRWFVLDPHAGRLVYYLKEEHKSARRERGSLQLEGAMVEPSEDDALAFTVVPNVAGHECYKLKAASTKQRQMWINRIRAAAEDQHSQKLNKAITAVTKAPQVSDQIRRGTARETAVLHQLHRVLSIASDQQANICRQIDALPDDRPLLAAALIVKSVSHSLLDSLEHCQSLVSHMAVANNNNNNNTTTPDDTTPLVVAADVTKASAKALAATPAKQQQQRSSPSSERPTQTSALPDLELYEDSQVEDGILIGDDVTLVDDDDDDVQQVVERAPLANYSLCAHDVLASVDAHKTHILELVSRLKLGTDLTKIGLPTYVLQSRSLLECLCNAFANAPLLLTVSDQPSPAARMLHFVKWYLTSFTSVLFNGDARKPYNPILGEVFRCAWTTAGGGQSEDDALTCIAEQVSHHPPVSCVYARCARRGLHVSAFVQPRVKFMGMSIACSLNGHAKLLIGTAAGHAAEEYQFGYPNVFARSIVSTPWLELTGKCQLSCQPTGCTATVTFHEKPFYGGKLHRVSADVRNADGTPFASVNGEWDGQLNVTLATTGEVSTLDVRHAAAGVDRCLRPVDRQLARESRRLWANVTAALRADNDQQATVERNKIVSAQQQRLTASAVTNYESRHFCVAPSDADKPGGQWMARQYPLLFQ